MVGNCGHIECAGIGKGECVRIAKHEAVEHPNHYGGADNVYEAIKVIEAWKLNFALGSAVKYICRAGKKDLAGASKHEAAIVDLKKAHFYIGLEISSLEKPK
jgi:hypothetical protein